MAEDVDRTDDWTVDAKRLLDIGYEHEMQDAEEWLEEGHFISQTWFEQGNPPTAVQLSSKRPLMVHTYRRNTIHESYAHDAHPLVAFHHLLAEAPLESDVFISMPFFTDFLVIDNLARYAKCEKDGGRDLKIKIIFGPDDSNKAELQRFIGQSRPRYEAVKRLDMREYGVIHTQERRGKMMHSKTMITATAGMMGSYNYTYGSRFRHGEDGLVFDDKDMLNTYRVIFASVWAKSTPIEIQEPRDGKKRTAEEVTREDGHFGMD